MSVTLQPKTKMKNGTMMEQSMTIRDCSASQAASVVTAYMGEETTLCVKIVDSLKRTESHPFFLLLRDDGEYLLVCQDEGLADAELADEEDFVGDPPLYFTEAVYRESPVYHLLRCRERIMQVVKDMPCNILPVLLTGSRIINLEDVEPEWEKMGVVVHTEQRGVSPFSDAEIPAVCYQDLPRLIKSYKKACCEDKDAREALLGIDCKNEKQRYKVYREATDNKNNEVAMSNKDEEDEGDWDFDDFEMPKMPEGIDNAPCVEMLPPIDDAQGLLDGMVGMEKIKEDIRNMLVMSRYNDLLRKSSCCVKTHAISLHALFLGGPGTGKTTLARIYGGLLKKAGILSKGHTVVCTRASFIGPRWGDEEAKTNICLDLAKGGVLFIDEAYLLNSNHPNDPGRNVLQLMLPFLADEEQRDIAVVLAGYTKPMQDLIDTNQGLASRFTNRFEFQDLSLKELQEVSRLYIRKYNYHFTPTAWKAYCERLSQSFAAKTPEWGNARFVHNTLDRIFQMHAMRCVRRGVTGKQLFSLTCEDVRNTPFPEAGKKAANPNGLVRVAGFR